MAAEKKTHTLRPQPGMSIRMLADYMSSTEQGKRSFLTKCKYQPKAPLIQHTDAQESICEHVSSRAATSDAIHERIGTLRSGLQGSQFECEVAVNNADYLERYLSEPFALPPAVQEILRGSQMPALMVEGLNLTCRPQFVFKRVTRRNQSKIGLGFLRYAKGKALPDATACWQGAIAFGYLKTKLEQGLGDVDPEKELCLIFDVWTGRAHAAPSNAVYRFNEVKAACASIAQRWDNIAAPAGAIF